MPNHVTNIMTVNGPAEAVAELKATWFHAGSPDQKGNPELPDMVVDFNTLLPLPEGLDISCGSMSSSAEGWLKMKDDWLLSDEAFGKIWLASRLKEHFATLVDWQTDTVGCLKERVLSTPGLLEKIGFDRPYLEQIQRNIAVHGCPTWYEWCNRHWGTKWNAYHQYLNEWSDTSFSVTFDTAWSPPAPLFEILADAFPSVEMMVHYIDEGGGFAGTFTASDGLLEDFPCEDGDFKAFAEEHFGWTFDDDDDE